VCDTIWSARYLYTSVSDEPAFSVFTVTDVYHCTDCYTSQIVTIFVKYYCILPDTHVDAKHSFTFQIFWIIVKGPFWHSSSRLSLHVPCVQYSGKLLLLGQSYQNRRACVILGWWFGGTIDYDSCCRNGRVEQLILAGWWIASMCVVLSLYLNFRTL
jgi:hypothetical protein